MLAKPVFFMHIAKTAGSYLNAAVANAVGSDHTVFHVERFLGAGPQVRRMLDDGHQFISGHVMLRSWQAIEAELGQTFLKCTILRDPIEHLASHILWLDHYNRDDKQSEYNQLDRAHRRLVDLIGQTNLSNPAMLDELLTDLPPIGIRLLDNCQSRYFLFAPGGLESFTPLSLAKTIELRRSVQTFDVVLRQDDLGHGLSRLSGAMGVEIVPLEDRVNSRKSERMIDTENPLVRQILSKRTIVDQWLWRMVHADQAKVPAT